MGGKSSSKSYTTVSTEQTDRRIGATDNATVVAEGGQLTSNYRSDSQTNIKVERADADLVKASLGTGGAAGIIDKTLSRGFSGANGLVSTALEFSSRAADRDRKVVESALGAIASQARAASEQSSAVAAAAQAGGVDIKPILLASAAVVGLMVFMRR